MNYHPEKTLMGCLATFLFLIALMGAYLKYDTHHSGMDYIMLRALVANLFFFFQAEDGIRDSFR